MKWANVLQRLPPGAALADRTGYAHPWVLDVALPDETPVGGVDPGMLDPGSWNLERDAIRAWATAGRDRVAKRGRFSGHRRR